MRLSVNMQLQNCHGVLSMVPESLQLLSKAESIAVHQMCRCEVSCIRLGTHAVK